LSHYADIKGRRSAAVNEAQVLLEVAPLDERLEV
jgi:hypothetical protein